MVTPTQAKQAAKGVFLSYHPGESLWFDLAWDKIALEPSSVAAMDHGIDVLGLHASSSLTGAEAGMVDMVALLVQVCLVQMPQVQDTLFDKLKSVCESKGKSNDHIEQLRNQLSEQLGIPTAAQPPDSPPPDNSDNWLLWIYEGTFPPAPSRISQTSAQQHFENATNYDIFVREVEVLTARGTTQINLSLSELRLLLVLLLQRKFECSVEQLYTGYLDKTKALEIVKMETNRTGSLDHLVGNIMSTLRSKMKNGANLISSKFEIPPKKPGFGFLCIGSASVCILMNTETLDKIGITL